MDNRLYSNKHFWVLLNNDIAMIGITDFLQEKLGSIMFLNLPAVGEELVLGEKFGDIESKKTVMDLEAPVGGFVYEVNESLLDEPYLINEEPLESWFLKIKPYTMHDGLMDENEYKEKIQQPWMKNHQ